MYPFEKYHYYVAGDKVIATSTYAGKTVRGIAKCAEGDTFDVEKGKRLAALRCAEKVAKKRLKRAMRQMHEATWTFEQARLRYKDMTDYYRDATKTFCDAQIETKNFEATL